MSSHDQIVHQLIWRNCQDAWKTDDRLSGRLTYRVIDLALCINIRNSIQNESWRIPNMKEEDPFHKCYINLAPLKWSSLRRRYANKKFHGKRGLFPHLCWDVTLIFISRVKLKKIQPRETTWYRGTHLSTTLCHTYRYVVLYVWLRFVVWHGPVSARRRVFS